MEAKNETKFSEISDTLKSFISELQGEMLITQDEVIRIKKSIREDNTDELESAISDLSKKLNNVKSDPVQQVPSEITVKIDDKTLSKMKGEKGDKGDKGDSIKGKDGYTPIKGVDYFDGKNGSPDTGEQIVEKINTLENVIDIKTIKDFPIIEGTADIKRQMDTIGNQVLRLLSRPKTTGGGGGTWGSITGTLSDQTDLQSALNAKQDSIITGTTAQYLKGDLSLGTFPTNVSTFTNDSGYITSSSLTGYLQNNVGIAGGTTLIGGTASGNNLTLSSTSNATKGKILFGTSAYDEVNNRLGIGISSPVVKLHVLTGTYIAPASDTNYIVQNSGQYVAEYIGTDGSYAGFMIRSTSGSASPFTQYYNSTTGKAWTQMMTTAGDLNILKGSAVGTTLLTLGNNLNVGIGQTSPTARLHIAAGTASAGTSPLKFTSGTNLTTPEAGAMEYDGTSLYFSPSTTRRTVVLDTATQTLTNKRINPRVQAVTSASTVTPSADNDDEVVITAQGAALTLANWSGTPVQGQAIIIRIKDDSTARAITFDTLYRAVGAYLPTTTVIGKTVYIACIYNSTDTKIDVVSVAQEI